MARRKNARKDLESRLSALRSKLKHGLQEQLQLGNVSSTHHPTELMDIACDGEADEMALRLAEADSMKIEEIEEALQRIKDGSYGICRECGKAIPKKRLKIMPFATLCIKCKEEDERRNFRASGGIYIRGTRRFSILNDEDDDPANELGDDVLKNVESKGLLD